MTTTARRLAIESHLPLVAKLARKVRSRVPSADLDDLIGVGTVGLCEAARRFRRGRGASFATFAWYRIEGAMLDHVRGETCWMGGARHGDGPRRRDLDVYALPLPVAPPPVTERLDVARLLALLPDRQRRLIVGVHLAGRQLTEVSGDLGIKKSWGSRLMERGMAEMRAAA